MTESAQILDFASAQQRRATAPAHSAWVEANAGTGKTKVLTDRVTRLLLAGVKPERILCLTFTKAAAAEMRNRLSAQLGRWAMSDDKALDAAIAKLIDREPEAEERTTARRLFARVLDAPGGINILTIHAFCQALLKRFPLEAGVAPGFEVMDEADATHLLRQAQDNQIEALAGTDAPKMPAAALALVAGKVSVAEYTELMSALLRERAWLLSRIGDDSGLDRVRGLLARKLHCDKSFELKPDASALRRASDALFKGSDKDVERGRTIIGWLDGSTTVEAYKVAFLKKDGDVLSRLATKAAVTAWSGVINALTAEAERLREEIDHARNTALVDLTIALLRLGLDITERYALAKRRRGLLDYDDLIVATRRLLSSTEEAAWVLYKLDGGLDHVLVDEAQDTNPDQWEVIRSLTSEFFAGQGAVDRVRTVFAVGDAKQSIFGFQRADPRKLTEMRGWFEKHIRAADKRFEPVDLTVSFRSTPALLDAVDAVFRHPDAAKGVVGEHAVEHVPIRTNEPGKVEVWPLCAATKEAVDTTDLDAKRATSALPHERLAQLIAIHAKGLIDAKERRPRDGELLHPGHFMVLVRRRNAFVNSLVRELKEKSIEVAGVDRLDLAQELAVMDLLAMARFVLLPQDDLNLACLLKSPLIGLDEDRLFALAYGRSGSLWRALREKAGEADFKAAYKRLSRWLARADFVTPFEFFAQALGPEDGRKHLLERLGRQASDPIDELLARALQYQRIEAASLQGFVRWFEEGGGDIKRDLDANRRQEVRILTVHASKGLQAPIVYLPDTTRVPRNDERLLTQEDGDLRLWLPRTGDASEAALTWRRNMEEQSHEEQNRLLYVAMTRAEDRLYVSGYHGKTKPDNGCWYYRITTALAESKAVEKDFDFSKELGKDGWAGKGFELANEGVIATPDQQELALAKTEDLPDWIDAPPPRDPDPPVPLAPSQPLPDEAREAPRASSSLAPDSALRWQRGQLIHELLRQLPALDPARRESAARAYLGQPGHGLAPEDVAAWTLEALAVMSAPDHAALFATGSRAEVPVVGTVKTPRGTFTVSGQVDRLAVSEREVLIVDYKTNRPPPSLASDVPLVYRRQLALYRALLQAIYPGRPVRAFLLWTAVPLLMEIDAKTLDNSMPYAKPS